MSHFLCSSHYNEAWTESFQLPRDPITFTAYTREMAFKLICKIKLPFYSHYFETNLLWSSRKWKRFTRQWSSLIVTPVNALRMDGSAELFRKCNTELAMLLFSYNSELFLTPTQLPVSKVQWGSFLTEKRPRHGDDHPHPQHLAKRLKKSGALPPSPPLSLRNML